jgi:TRAP-type C4-dicarboxylate transport system permease small subunit
MASQRHNLKQAAGSARVESQMTPVVRLVDRFSELVDRAVQAFLLVMLAAMVVVAGVGVFFRYVLNSSLSWSDELATWMFVWLAFLGASSLLRRGGHLGMTIAINRLRGMPLRLAAGIGGLFVGLVLSILIWAGLLETIAVQRDHAAALPLSQSVLYAALPTAGVLMLIHLASVLVTGRRLIRGYEPEERAC